MDESLTVKLTWANPVKYNVRHNCMPKQIKTNLLPNLKQISRGLNSAGLPSDDRKRDGSKTIGSWYISGSCRSFLINEGFRCMLVTQRGEGPNRPEIGHNDGALW